jgi:hypothetical protein
MSGVEDLAALSPRIGARADDPPVEVLAWPVDPISRRRSS